MFDNSEVGYMRDVLDRKGGYYRQYECIVRTPERVDGKVVRVYRKGKRIYRLGNDDPG